MMNLIVGGILIGFFASMTSGLFGGGAGLVTVPAIFWLLAHTYPHNPHLMQITLATGGAISMPLGLVAALRQLRYENVDIALLKRFLLIMSIGGLLAAILITHTKSSVIKGFFSALIFCMAVWMWRYRSESLKIWKIPAVLYQGFAFLIGFISVGIGVSVLGVPFFIKSGLDIRKAVGTSTVVVFVYSSLSAMALLIFGFGKTHLPAYNVSYWNMPILHGDLV